MNRSVSTMSGKTKLKVVLLGNQSVGKSCIIERYVKDHFEDANNPTVGIDFLVKNVTHQGKTYRLQLWDTAGQERFRSLIPTYLKDAKCALIIIDVSNRSSINNVEMWLKLYNDNRTVNGKTLLVGNKIDLEYREISFQEGQKKAEQLGIPYYQISAKTAQKVEELFEHVIDIYENRVCLEKEEVIKEEEDNEDNEQKKEDQPKQMPNKIQSNNVNQYAGGQTKTTAPENIVLKNEKVEKGKKQTNTANCCT